MKKYYPVKANNKGTTDLRVELTYDLGGYNMFDYTPKARGYYLVVTPVTRQSGFESFTVGKCCTSFGYERSGVFCK